MNPFLHSTVAEPLASSPRPSGRGMRPVPAVSSNAPAGARRPRRVARHVAFMAGLGISAGLAAPVSAVDINSANPAQLQSIRGIGPHMAAQIVRERQDGGAFASYEDLADRVRGMGPKRVKRFRESGLTLAPGSQAAHGPDIVVNTPGASKVKKK